MNFYFDIELLGLEASPDRRSASPSADRISGEGSGKAENGAKKRGRQCRDREELNLQELPRTISNCIILPVKTIPRFGSSARLTWRSPDPTLRSLLAADPPSLGLRIDLRSGDDRFEDRVRSTSPITASDDRLVMLGEDQRGDRSIIGSSATSITRPEASN